MHGSDPMQNKELLVDGDERTLQWSGDSSLDTSEAGAFTTAYCRYYNTQSSSFRRALPKCILPLAYHLCFCWGGYPALLCNVV